MLEEFIIKKNQMMFSTATLYFCKELGLTEEDMSMITVQQVSSLEKGTYGTCLGIYVKDVLQKIEIRLLSHASTFALIDVLAHELIHARQHLRGEFTTVEIKHPIFFGLMNITVSETYHKGQNQLKTPYYDRICEIEAHALAHSLTVGYCSLLKPEKETDLKSECIYAHI